MGEDESVLIPILGPRFFYGFLMSCFTQRVPVRVGLTKWRSDDSSAKVHFLALQQRKWDDEVPASSWSWADALWHALQGRTLDMGARVAAGRRMDQKVGDGRRDLRRDFWRGLTLQQAWALLRLDWRTPGRCGPTGKPLGRVRNRDSARGRRLPQTGLVLTFGTRQPSLITTFLRYSHWTAWFSN